jgi:RimJ/RimL family protein N-acetyltransferase
MADARARLELDTLMAIVNPANAASIRLLERLGFVFERPMRLPTETDDLQLFVTRI